MCAWTRVVSVVVTRDLAYFHTYCSYCALLVLVLTALTLFQMMTPVLDHVRDKVIYLYKTNQMCRPNGSKRFVNTREHLKLSSFLGKLSCQNLLIF